MKKWIKKEFKNGNLNNLAEVNVSDVYSSLQSGDITREEGTHILLEAIQLAESEVDYLGYMTESDDNWFRFAARHLSYRRDRLNNLLEYASELNIDVVNGIDSQGEIADAQVSNASVVPLSRIMWKGKKSDLGRVYTILAHLIECTKTEWERHFIGKNGEDMIKATDDHKGGNSRSPEIMTLQNAGRVMEPE